VALNEIWIPSPNYSSRDPGQVRLVVLHTTEGVQRIRDLGYFFQGDTGSSSHSGSDNYEDFVYGAYVDENDKAWTQANANPYCISLEQCTPSGAANNWSRDYWLTNYERLLRNSAHWVAEMCAKWNVPIVSLSANQANSGQRGVCDHVDLGANGGGHSDCGPGYPMDMVIQWAKEDGSGGQPEPEESDMSPASVYVGDDLLTACIGLGNNHVFFKASGWGAGALFQIVDEGSNAKSGVDITAQEKTEGNPHPLVTITYTNMSNEVCTYHRRYDTSDTWAWTNLGGQAE
jgi:hypothetical protein